MLNTIKPQDAISIVIFGATGDLVGNKLMPSLYRLFLDDLLPDDFMIVGFGRSNLSREKFVSNLREEGDYEERAEQFFNKIDYYTGEYDRVESYSGLGEVLTSMPGNRLFYLAVPPNVVRSICTNLKKSGVSSNCSCSKQSPYCVIDRYWSRIILEKPFGTDYKSAKDLNEFVGSLFNEDQIFRIDHYLGKETVQNILAFRFANAIFEPIWNSRYIDHIEVTIFESDTVKNRGVFFDSAGIVRDTIQNHALQLLALTTMEAPVDMSAEAIRDEKVKLIRSLKTMCSKEVLNSTVRGQYQGYLDSQGVAADSKTETYAAIKFNIQNWRWSKTPIYLKAGKGLDKKNTEISIHYNSVPHQLFFANGMTENKLTFRIQPDEGIHLDFMRKKPSESSHVEAVDMNFSYQESNGGRINTAYEKLLIDVMQNDTTLFIRDDEIEASWRFIDPILKTWEEVSETPLKIYPVGSDGIKED